MNIFRIVYTQEIVASPDNQMVEAEPQVFFQISRQAASTGWLRENFGGHRNGDFAALVAIGLHARRLVGPDLDLLIRLGLATQEDAGRLYARVTDMGLADILGRGDPKKVRGVTDRLASLALLRILNLPPGFRDSRGQFAGDRAYLLMANQVISQADDRASNSGFHGVSKGHPVESDGVSKGHPVEGDGVSKGHPVRVSKGHTKINFKDLTLANASGSLADEASADDPSAASNLFQLPLFVPAAGNEADRPTSARSGNGQGVNGIETAAKSGPEGDSLPAGRDASCPATTGALEGDCLQTRLDELNAVLEDADTQRMFDALLHAVQNRTGGLAEAGFRMATRMLQPLPERRRRVLDDLRRMKGAEISPAKKQRNINAILTYNIGATIGLGLESDGSLRSAPQRGDYAIVGELAKLYGAETTWITACEVAGVAIEGDPLAYLRAALHRKAHRESEAAGSGGFEQLDYSSCRVSDEE